VNLKSSLPLRPQQLPRVLLNTRQLLFCQIILLLRREEGHRASGGWVIHSRSSSLGAPSSVGRSAAVGVDRLAVDVFIAVYIIFFELQDLQGGPRTRI